MTPFTELIIPPTLNTSSGDIIQDFFVPLLKSAKFYDRGVGFFSSGWIRLASQGLAEFAENGGKARWVTSPILSTQDWAALKEGTEAQENEILYESLKQNIIDLQKSLDEATLEGLAWMVADGILEFRLAVPQNKLDGEFHDKFGVFEDEDGNRISFNGSYNDSIQGTQNYESIKIFKSWNEFGQPLVEHDHIRFSELWLNQDPNIRTYQLDEKSTEAILKLRKSKRPYKKPPSIALPEIKEPDPGWGNRTLAIPPNIVLREYQEEAIHNWINAGYCGIFNMATATGKTITALAGLVGLIGEKERLVTVVSCPNTHLVLQWEKEAREFGFEPMLAFDTRKKWSEKVKREIARYGRGSLDTMMIITTNATLTNKNNALQKMLNKVSPEDICFIADEAHNLGATTTRLRLPKQYKYRLALTATPVRYFDDAGSQFLLEYFGGSVIEISLAFAIENDFLSRYRYYPHVVYLNDDESAAYAKLSKQIQKLSYLINDKTADDTKLQRLLERRIALLNNAEAKTEVLEEVLNEMETLQKSLFYCSDKQIDDLCTSLIANGYFVKRVTYKDKAISRQKIFQEFDDGLIQALVAIGVLDEGLDIPSTEFAFILASTGNPKQFIQRRGRVLRKPKSGTKIATIHDFIALPNESIGEDKYVKHALERELKRFTEFAGTSENKIEAQAELWDIALKYGLVAEV